MAIAGRGGRMWDGAGIAGVEVLSSSRCPGCHRVLSPDRKSRYTGVVRTKRGTRIDVAFLFLLSSFLGPFVHRTSSGPLEATRAGKQRALSSSDLLRGDLTLWLLSSRVFNYYLLLIATFHLQKRKTEVGVVDPLLAPLKLFKFAEGKLVAFV